MECECTQCVVRDNLLTLSREYSFEEYDDINKAETSMPNASLRHVRLTDRAELSRTEHFDIMLASRRSQQTLSNGRRTPKKPGIAN